MTPPYYDDGRLNPHTGGDDVWRLSYVRDAVVMCVDHVVIRVHELTQAWLDRGIREVERYLKENAERHS